MLALTKHFSITPTEASCSFPSEQPSCSLTSSGSLWDPWEEEINKVYSSAGKRRGILILPPPTSARSETSTYGLDGCCGQLLQPWTKGGAELWLWAQSAHTPFCWLSCVMMHMWVSCVGPSDWNKSKEKRETERCWQNGVWETIRGVMTKGNPSTAESRPMETPQWRNEPTAQSYNATIEQTVESRKKNKAGKK